MGRKTSIYASDDLEAVLAPRVSDLRGISPTISTIATRYAGIVSREVAELELTLSEWLLICDGLNGSVLVDGWGPSYLVAEIEDHVRLNAADEKWHLGGQNLLAHLAALSYPQLVAVSDVVERFWSVDREEADHGQVLRALGVKPATKQRGAA